MASSPATSRRGNGRLGRKAGPFRPNLRLLPHKAAGERAIMRIADQFPAVLIMAAAPCRLPWHKATEGQRPKCGLTLSCATGNLVAVVMSRLRCAPLGMTEGGAGWWRGAPGPRSASAPRRSGGPLSFALIFRLNLPEDQGERLGFNRGSSP